MTMWHLVGLLCWWLGVVAVAVQRDQGVPDARAVVGRVFRMTIPDNAFQGPVERYEVTEAGENNLPAWLMFDSEQKQFQGVPDASDSGQLYICIKAITGDSTAKDVFSIEVADEATTNTYCQFGQEETIASIIFDAALPDLSPARRLHLVESTAAHLNLAPPKLRLSPLPRDESSFDPLASRAGPGDVPFGGRGEGVLRIRFAVGCSGDVASEFEPVLAALERAAAGGELSDDIRVVGWQVSSRPLLQHNRDRRNVTPLHATPVPKMHVTRWPIYTERIIDRSVVPSARIVPTMASPRYFDRTFTDHRHRHHHGLDPLRRDHVFPTTSEVQASPSFRFHPFSTPQLSSGTPLPTPVLYPERPTTTVLPTRIYEIEGTLSLAPPPLSEDVLSRWYVTTSDLATADIRPTRSRVDAVEPTRIMPPQITNFKPTVNSRTKKLSLVAGKAWRYAVPIDTFVDMEDGNTRDLKLMFMTSERTSLPSSHWIQFDPERQEIYALPLSENVGKHEYILEAMDSEGASTFDRVELHVWEHPQASALTHSFTMTVRFNKWEYPVGIDWQVEVLSRLARMFNDTDNSTLRVLTVTLDPIRFSWTNDTLPTEPCPVETIRRLFDVISTPEHHPTKEMKRVMSEFRVQDIGVRYLGSCQGIVTTPPPPKYFTPQVLHKIGRINVTAGDVVKFKIPENTFYDFEDGYTRQLRLTLLTKDNVQPDRSYWLQFDPRTQEVYGLPTDGEVGRHDFSLDAADSDDRTVTESFVIHVSRLPRRQRPPVEFSVRLDTDFDGFDTGRRVLVAAKIARLYGDPDPRYILVTNVTRGSVVYGWSNKTLGNDYCPKERIDQLVKYIIAEDGSLTSDLVQVMEPEFRVSSADAQATGVCLGGVPPTFVTLTTTTPAPSPPPDELEPTLKTSTDDDIYVTTIVPAVVIAVMLVIAAVVAYFLYWRKRKGKMSLGDKDFIGSGVPVVFAGELEEQKPDPGKAPAIMKNEKPPLSTDYLVNPFRRASPPLRDTPAPYKPPPPFPLGREAKSTRPKNPQAYSRQATYVPP